MQMQERRIGTVAMACLSAILLLGTAAAPCSAEQPTTPVSVEEACRTAASAQAGVSYDHCVSTLLASSSDHAADMQRLAVVAARMAADHAAATGARMEGLGEAEESARARARLRHCLDLYGGAADALRDALDNLRVRVYGRASQQLAAALGASESCEDAWKGEEKAPVAAHDREYGRLALLALGLTTGIMA